MHYPHFFNSLVGIETRQTCAFYDVKFICQLFPRHRKLFVLKLFELSLPYQLNGCYRKGVENRFSKYYKH